MNSGEMERFRSQRLASISKYLKIEKKNKIYSS